MRFESVNHKKMWKSEISNIGLEDGMKLAKLLVSLDDANWM